MPTVSIVLPAFDAEATIVDTVQSVRRQTFTDFELIVVDDGSRDGTLRRLGEIRDARVVVLSRQHGGVSRARNHGITRATGEFLSFIDADDLWTEDKLELQIEALRAHPEADAAYSWTAFVDERGRFLFPKERRRFVGRIRDDLLRENFLASASNALARHRCIAATGIFEPRFSPADDWEFWLRMAAVSAFVPVPRYQVLYRFRFDSLSADPQSVHAAMHAVLEHTVSAQPAKLGPHRRAAVASIEQYVSFLYLTRTRSPRARSRAARHLLECLRRQPAGILTRKVLGLIALWLVAHLVPAAKVPGVAQAMLRAYGGVYRFLVRDVRRLTASA